MLNTYLPYSNGNCVLDDQLSFKNKVNCMLVAFIVTYNDN